MIPTNLQMYNFMSYRGPIDVDLQGIRVACLSGDNGAGKSALLDAMTWALWGKARVNSDRELIALNGDDMEVTFSFLLDGHHYRVRRRRLKRGAGPLHIDLQAHDGNRWRSVAEDSARETQVAIDQLLRMDYETFINSAFLLQGRADEFTTKTPAKRKDVLAEILKLDEYDNFEEQARKEFRERERRITEIDGRLDEIEVEISEIPELERKVADFSSKLIELADQARATRAEADEQHKELNRLDFVQKQQDSLLHQLGEIDREVSEYQEAIAELERTIKQRETLLENAARVRQDYARYQQLLQENEEMSTRLQKHQALVERRHTVEREISQIQYQEESKLSTLQTSIQEREKRIADADSLPQRIRVIQERIQKSDNIDGRLDALRTKEVGCRTERGERQSENQRLRDEMNALRDKLDQLHLGEARCPVCQQPLSTHERDTLQKTYTAEGKSLADQYRENEKRLYEIEQEIPQLQEQQAELNRQRESIENERRQLAILEERLSGVETDRAERERLQQTADQLSERLKSGEVAKAERDQAQKLQQEITDVGYEQRRHKTVSDELQNLRSIPEKYQEIQQAETLLEPNRQQLAQYRAMVDRRYQERTGIDRQIQESKQDLANRPALEKSHQALRDQLSQLELQRTEMQSASGGAQAQLQRAQDARDRKESLVAERANMVDEQFIYEELGVAFGKRGIQAMIIENIVPELQDETNRILDQMPANSMRVEFRTQRQSVSGDRIIETLDIVIGDEIGRRPYELYSGGEAFRINFAIRVALSSLLARRAGARLETLIIDEGFGTQDAKGQDGLIEAIRAVESDFEMILVITHIPELKDLFPTRIDVQKTTNGSTVQVM